MKDLTKNSFNCKSDCCHFDSFSYGANDKPYYEDVTGKVHSVLELSMEEFIQANQFLKLRIQNVVVDGVERRCIKIKVGYPAFIFFMFIDIYELTWS